MEMRRKASQAGGMENKRATALKKKTEEAHPQETRTTARACH